MVRRVLIVALFLVVSFHAAAATQGGPIPVPLPLFPANNWWNTDVSNAPLDPSSADFITYIGPAKGLHPDFGGDAGGGDTYGFPFIVVDSTQPKKTVTFVDFGSQSDGDGVPFYPVPDEAITLNGWVEGGQPGNVDQRGTQKKPGRGSHLHPAVLNQWHRTIEPIDASRVSSSISLETG